MPGLNILDVKALTHLYNNLLFLRRHVLCHGHRAGETRPSSVVPRFVPPPPPASYHTILPDRPATATSSRRTGWIISPPRPPHTGRGSDIGSSGDMLSHSVRIGTQRQQTAHIGRLFVAPPPPVRRTDRQTGHKGGPSGAAARRGVRAVRLYRALSEAGVTR